MSAREWLYIGLMLVGVLLFVIGWFVPKWSGITPAGGVIFVFCVVAAIVFATGAIALGL